MPQLYKNLTRRQKFAVVAAVVLAVFLTTSGWWLHHAINATGLKAGIEAYLSQELQSTVTIGNLEGGLIPTVSVSGSDVVVHEHGRTDVPPLLTIKGFDIRGSYSALMMQKPRHVAEVKLRELLVQIPPDKDHDDADKADKTDEIDNTKDGAEGRSAGAAKYEQIIIDRFEAPDTILKLYSSKPHKPPKEFIIHHLVMDSAGANQVIPYIATLTNPIPKGEIETSGTFGPWNALHPARTPVSGKYTFAHADLGTIDGLSGILSSEGEFKGPINRIEVNGTTTTPDFQVDAGGKAVPLTTKFSAVVDGSDGDTYLTRVDGKFLNTALVAKGKVIGLEGVRGRQVEVDVDIEHGRIEDVLKLAMDSDRPILVGPIRLRANVFIPAEKGKKVIEKMKLRGQFGLTSAKFTDPTVQQKLIGLSRHGQGKSEDEAVGEVVSDLKGQFVVDHAVARFSQLTFGVPGALVVLAGSYGLKSEVLDFKGELRLQAPLSKAVGGGVKGFFLKAFDPFFRKQGAGTVLPIKITGTRKDPKFGLNLFGKDK